MTIHNDKDYTMKPLEEMVSTSDPATSLEPVVETKEKARRKLEKKHK